MRSSNNAVSQIIKVIAKLVKTSTKDMLQAGFLNSVESAPITTYRANCLVRLVGRKWLAPLYRPYGSSFVVKKGAFLTVRENGRTADIEGIIQGETTTITMKTQDWNEKKAYFLQIPANRLRGRLAMTVRQLIKARKQREKQDE